MHPLGPAGRVAVVLLVGLGLVAGLTGCGQDASSGAAASASRPVATAPVSGPGEPVTPSTSPAETTSALPVPSASGSATRVAPTGPAVPAETAGSLGSDDVPAPPDLGAGWTRYVDPGDAEEGYAGNGTWVRARGGAEVVQALVPLGCSGLTSTPRLPVPRHALEATYRGPGGAPAVALVFSYRSANQARALLAGLAGIGRSCAEPAGTVRPRDPMVAVVTQVRADDTQVLDRRRELGAGASPWVWSEAVVRRGSRVGLLTVASLAGDPPPALDLLAAAIRP